MNKFIIFFETTSVLFRQALVWAIKILTLPLNIFMLFQMVFFEGLSKEEIIEQFKAAQMVD